MTGSGSRTTSSCPGRVPDAYVADVLSTADVGLSPDPMNPLNDLSTMNKTMEYMSFGLPVVAFDLVETRVSAGDAAVYADPESGPRGFAEALVALLDDPHRRIPMGSRGRQRVEHELAWEHQAPSYLAVFDELTGPRAAWTASAPAPERSGVPRYAAGPTPAGLNGRGSTSSAAVRKDSR